MTDHCTRVLCAVVPCLALVCMKQDIADHTAVAVCTQPIILSHLGHNVPKHKVPSRVAQLLETNHVLHRLELDTRSNCTPGMIQETYWLLLLVLLLGGADLQAMPMLRITISHWGFLICCHCWQDTGLTGLKECVAPACNERQAMCCIP